MRFFRNWMAVFLVLGTGVAWAGEALVVADFDQVNPETFDFKDEKGSVLSASGAYPDDTKGKGLGIRYDIQPEGFGGWGVAMKGADVSKFRYLAFDLHGDVGGELFEVGLRDTKGQEKKKGIGTYIDTPVKWKRVFMPLSDFTGVNTASLDNLSLGFGSKQKGRVYLDNIAFEGASGAGSVPAAGDVANKIVVDGFDRPNAETAYRTFAGDGSSVDVIASRVIYDGDYSMEIRYQLLTDTPWGSWVSALRVPAQPMDWTGVDTIKIWVKGDGSDNSFRLRFKQADGQSWEMTDKKAISKTRWTQVIMPISEFKLVGQPPRGTPPNLVGIKSYELAVVSPGASSNAGGKTSAGRIWVDLMSVTGERLGGGRIIPTAVPAAPGGAVQAAAPAPAPVPAPAGKTSNLDFSLVAYTEYFHTPEEQSQVNSNVKLITSGKLGNFSATVELGTDPKEPLEYGQSAAYIGSTVTTTENQYADVQNLSYQVFAHNVLPTLSLVTLGNQFIDYGSDVMTPIFGFRGISAEGDWEQLNYTGFVLKHSQNSFSAGARGTYFFPKWQLKYSGAYWEQTGKHETPTEVVGTDLRPIADTETLKLDRLAQDLVYNVNVLGRLVDEKVRLESTYGYNSYSQSGVGDFTDPFNPIFTDPVTPIYRAGGSLWRSSVRTYSLLIPGMEASYGYRDIEEGYKPHYRQNPIYYDDTDSDQWGHNFKLVEQRAGWMASVEYDTLRRHSDSNDFQHKFNWAVGHYGYRGIDVTLSQEYKRYVYNYTSDRSNFTTGRNDKTISTEIYVRAQLSPRLAGWIKPKQDRIWHPEANNNFTSDSLQARLEFYIANNAKLFADYKVSRYDNPANEPKGEPFDDNFTRVSFEVTF